MKRQPLYLILATALLTSMSMQAEQKKCVMPPRIGDQAPEFTADSTKGKITFPTDYKGKWIIFFSHPADFTPVCTTEFKRLAGLQDDLEHLNTILVGTSVDKSYTHEIWMRDLAKQLKKEGKKERTITFPVIADTDRKVANRYGFIHPNESKTQTIRAVFIIDPKGKIRAQLFYPQSIGRSFNEVKRLLLALQTSDAKNVATPADWKPCKPTIPKETIKKDVMPK